MFKLMLTFKARLDIKNNQGLTPLTLAAKLARKEVRIDQIFYQIFKTIYKQTNFNRCFSSF